MQFVGVFSALSGFNKPVIFTTNPGGLLEVINKGSYDILVDIPTGGTVCQEARSKCIYKMQNIQGQQTIQFMARGPSLHDIIYGWNGTFSPDYDVIYVNVYQAGEIEWYPPTSLTIPEIKGGVSSETSVVNAGTTGTILTIPAASPTPPLQNGYLQLVGFDVGVSAGTFENHALQVTGFLGGQLEYMIGSLSNNVFYIGPRWDPPVTSIPNTAITFALGAAFATATVRINAFWYEVFK